MKRMRIFLLSLLVVFLWHLSASSQAPTVSVPLFSNKDDTAPLTEWVKTFGGTNDDRAYSIAQTDDGGFIVVGYTQSFTKAADEKDIYVLKLAANGLIEWQRFYSGLSKDGGITVKPARDGGYLVAAAKDLFFLGGKHIYLLKLRRDGHKEWEKMLAASKEDTPLTITQTHDGGYVLSGYSSTHGAGGMDMLVIKVDSKGKRLWARTLGGRKDEMASTVTGTADGGILVAGYTTSFGSGGKDALIVKLRSDGSKIWSSVFGFGGDEVATSALEEENGNFFVSGFRHTLLKAKDILIAKFSESGVRLWTKVYAGPYDDIINATTKTADGGYLLAGQIFTAPTSFGGNTYVMKVNTMGNVQWEKKIDSYLSSEATSVVNTHDGGFMIAGSIMGEVSKGEADIYVVKVSPMPETAVSEMPGTSHESLAIEMR